MGDLVTLIFREGGDLNLCLQTLCLEGTHCCALKLPQGSKNPYSMNFLLVAFSASHNSIFMPEG